MAEKRGRGKPKRYEGEDSVRLSVLLRPRYKKLIELVSKDRQSTLSEALEFIIASFGSHYLADGKPILDFVRSKYERLAKYYSCTLPFTTKGNDVRYGELIRSDYLDKLKELPRSTLSKEDLFLIDILDPIYDGMFLGAFYANEYLVQEIKEDWKIGRSTKEVLADLGFIIELILNGEIESFADFLDTYNIDADVEGVDILGYFTSYARDLALDKEMGAADYIEKYSNIERIREKARDVYMEALNKKSKSYSLLQEE